MGRQLRIVEYTLPYRHRVQVGIPSTDDEEATGIAQAAFEAGTIWDDTQEMPLLYDDFEEEDSGLEFVVVATVEIWPAPDASVLQKRREASAVAACRSLVAAMRLREQADVPPDDVDRALTEAYNLAMSALGGTPPNPAIPTRPRVVVGVDGGLVQGVSSDLPVELVVVDYDMRDTADGAVIVPQSGGGEETAAVISHQVALDPQFVDAIWKVEAGNVR
ncbi:hypothetical protein EZJ19_07820 [Parasulfuritortus cantonensis]|uniref:Uncharacterized protein n=1 Tax=Parasulfuritortus cantonensis TaxID=2528202 RepID=A0A4R1BDT9_9PROT|nr:hypothetical protein [Parasulfuritortus cantonensis]TCJ15207.1 hypothetical protein EZJ19_07820 [Parasulfuritortus cantonensis]